MSQWLEFTSDPSYDMPMYDNRPRYRDMSPTVPGSAAGCAAGPPPMTMSYRKPKQPIGLNMLARRSIQPKTADRELLGTSSGSVLTYNGEAITDVAHKYLPPLTPQNDYVPNMAQRTKYQAGEAAVTQSDPVHMQYYKSGGYDDYHKTYLRLKSLGMYPTAFPLYGPPRLRHGRAGGSWRHVKEVLQAGGSRTVFVDGLPRREDNERLEEGEVPDGNIIQPTHREPSQWANGYRVKTQPKPPPTIAAYQLDAHKGTEGANWRLMR